MKSGVELWRRGFPRFGTSDKRTGVRPTRARDRLGPGTLAFTVLVLWRDVSCRLFVHVATSAITRLKGRKKSFICPRDG